MYVQLRIGLMCRIFGDDVGYQISKIVKLLGFRFAGGFSL